MLISPAGRQRLDAIRAKDGNADLEALLKGKNVDGLVAKGLSKLDALALLQDAADRGIDAVFAKQGAAKALISQGDGTAGSQQAVLEITGSRPAANNAVQQRIALVMGAMGGAAEAAVYAINPNQVLVDLAFQTNVELGKMVGRAALALYQDAADRGIDAVSAKQGAAKALISQGDGTAGSQAVLEATGAQPAANNAVVQRMALLKGVVDVQTKLQQQMRAKDNIVQSLDDMSATASEAVMDAVRKTGR